MNQIEIILMEIKKEINESLLQSKEVFSLEEFCKYADITLSEGYKITSARKINFYRPGGKKIYIDRVDAIAYLRQNPINSHCKIDQVASNFLITSKKII